VHELPAPCPRVARIVKALCVAHFALALAWLDVTVNWGIALGIGIMALIEEVVFRRWLPDWLSPRLGITRAELVSALLFALAHWPWSTFLSVTAFGFAMSMMRSATGLLWPGVLAHIAHNAWVHAAHSWGFLQTAWVGTGAPPTVAAGLVFVAEHLLGACLMVWVLTMRHRRQAR
jgi:membrane protease YdiL (CAAX protease family)